MRVTAKQIAQELGVSPTTVSLAMRGKPGVSKAVRDKVLELALRYGLEPSGTYKAGRMRFLQLVIFKSHGTIVSDTPFFEQLTRGVIDEAQARGYQLSVSYLYGSQNMQEQIESINSSTCEGIIVLATEMQYADMEKLQVISHPLVILDNFFSDFKYDCISIDNISGARKAVRYLIDMGHRRIGYLHSKVDIRNFRERRSGYLAGCRSLPEPECREAAKRIISVGATTEAALKDMQAFLLKTSVLPTALFADNDRIAVGCCKALQMYGYQIPEDISIIGFDDSSLCTMLSPSLTSMNVQKQRMGALAVDRLISLIEHCSLPEMIHIKVVPNVIARETVLQLLDPLNSK